MAISDQTAALTFTDLLGRALPLSVPRKEKKRLVGLFYFLWLGEHGRHAPYDISKIVAAHPDAGVHPEAEYWGSVGTYHHWGEPLYGYYYSDDEWVMRKHIKLIMQAGIDFLFFDVTNAVTYDDNLMKLLAIMDGYRKEGFSVPKILFYTNTASGATAEHLYQAIYKPGRYKALWLYLDGKPLIIARPEECSEEVKHFFTIKLSQWPNEADKDDGWPWMDFTRPQRLFPDPKTGRTVMNASIAQHPQLRFGDSVLYGEESNCSRSFHDGKNDPAPNAYLYGYNFKEQMERAIDADPDILLITGWNEWIAGRWEGISSRPIMFVDTASPSYSRDAEMMRGGYGDLYFLQMMALVRKYKGTAPQAALSAGEVGMWRGFKDGALHRHAEGYGQMYHNETGRNAIAALSIRAAVQALIVRIETAEPIKEDKTGTYLRTYIGKEGEDTYRYLLCPEGEEMGIYRACGLLPGAKIAAVPLITEACAIEAAIPRHLLDAEGSPLDLAIKVADATVEYTCTDDFYDIGDVLPLGAANARFLAE